MAHSKTIFIFSLLFFSQIQCAYWSIPLDNVDVQESVAGTLGIVLDTPHYRTVNYITDTTEQPYNAVFDLTSGYNWAVSTTCVGDGVTISACPVDDLLNCDSGACIAKSTTSESQNTFILGGRGNLKAADEGSDDIKIFDKTFEAVPLIFPTEIDALLCEWEVQEAVGKGGLGIGYTSRTSTAPNFLNEVVNQITEIEKEQVSFYIDGNIDQIIFGDSEDYFASTEYTCYENLALGVKAVEDPLTATDPSTPEMHQQWELEVKSFTLGAAIDIPFLAGTTAIFDSTTKYIWTPSNYDETSSDNNIMDEIMEKLNINHGAQCAKDPSDLLYHCICTDKEFSEIYFGFGDSAESDETFAFEMDDYVEYHEEDSNQKTCNLIFRPARTFILQGTVTTDETSPLPQVSYYEKSFYLGTKYLEKIYTLFDQDDEQICMAEVYKVNPGNLTISNSIRITTIVVIIFIILISLGVLMSVLKKIGSPQQLPTQVVMSSQPQYVIQSQPVISSQQQIIGQSPIRYAQSYTG